MGGKRGGMTRGQATIFVVLGIVMVIAVIFAIYARGMLVNDQHRRQAERLVNEYIATTNLNYYVTGCLDEVTEGVLVEFGQEGGFLNATSRPGVEYLAFSTLEGEQKVAYGLIPMPSSICPEVAPAPPAYPKEEMALASLLPLYDQGICRYLKDGGFFGHVTLPPLCARNGPNSFAATPGSVTLPCPGEQTARPGEWSVQEELQERITLGLQECVRIEDYNLLGNNISLDASGIATTVVYKVDGIVVNATLPFAVSIEGGKAILTPSSFSIDSPIRLRRMYEYFHDVLASDARLLGHNLTKDYIMDTGYTATFTLVRTDDPCLYQELGCPPEMAFDDILTLQDENVLVKGRPYELRVALKDRYPALDLIRTANHQFADILASEGQRVIISPQGFDPDEMGVSYAYSGWKEDYNETFNGTCWERTMGNTPTFERLKLCTTKDVTAAKPKEWSASSLYVESGRSAWTRNTTHKDAGLHVVRVNVTDLDSFRQDYQDVRVLVFDLPVANITLYHPFTDIPVGFWSVEDAFLLDATSSTASAIAGAIVGYNWTGGPSGIPFQFRLFTIHKTALIPDNLSAWQGQGRFYARTGASLAAEDITKFPLAAPAGLLSPFTYQLNLSVSAGEFWSDPTSASLQIYRCLPTRAGAGAPYPYNTSTAYDHVCCQGTPGTPAGASWGVPYPASANVKCFTAAKSGLLAQLLAESFNGNPAVTPTSTLITVKNVAGATIAPTPAPATVPAVYTNDPFKLTVSRSCDGLRGNTCTGALNLTFTQVAACKDAVIGQNRRCQGPSSDYTTCSNYPTPYQGSFEGPDICSASPHCAAGNGAAFNPASDLSGRFLCWGACNSQTGECTKASSCACSTQCGAVCTGADPIKHLYVNGKCTYGCNLGTTCDYNYKDIPCPPSYVVLSQSSPKPGQAGFSFTTVHAPNKQEACFYQQSAAGPCTDNGCVYVFNILREGFCDACAPSGVVVGDSCPTPGLSGGFCFSGSRTCSGQLGTTCQLTRQAMSDAGCPEGTGPVCSAVSGISCEALD